MTEQKNPFESIGQPKTQTQTTQQAIPSLTSEKKQEQASEKVEVDAKSLSALFSAVSKSLESSQAQQIDYNKLAEAMAKAISKSSKDDGDDMYEIEEISIEDFLEKPAVFFAYTVRTAIFDDIRYGRPVRCPIQPVKFHPLYRYKSPDGKTISMSMAVVQSKRQAEFLRTHSLFNIKFFEEAQVNKTIDASFQEKLVYAFNSISGKSDYEVQRMALNMGVKIDTHDISEIKKRVAYKKAEQIIADEKIMLQNNQRVQVETSDNPAGEGIGELENDFLKTRLT